MSRRFEVARWVVVNAEAPDDPAYLPMIAPRHIAVPIVDDVPLFRTVGGHRWPGVPMHLVAPPAGHWLGEPSYVEFGRAVVLDGSCGIAECCGVEARIELHDDRVTWSDFYTNGAPTLSAGLAFTFERSEYEHAIASIVARDAHVWDPDAELDV